MADRHKTPPPRTHTGNLPSNPITPEQIRKTEEARLRAKAARATHDAARTNPPLKRTHSAMTSTAAYHAPANVRNAPAMTVPAADAALKPARNFARSAYIEYDFASMADTKGGFLAPTDDVKGMREDNGPQKPAGMTLEEWERLQLLNKLRKNKSGPFEPAVSVLTDKEERAKRGCRECGALDVEWTWVDVFGVVVCRECKERLPDKYSLLTKTEAREDYLLTNPELQDEELLPHLKRPNPHKSTWNDMQLYLRFQVEEYAFSARKWGSPEALDAEFERRQEDKKVRKDKKFKSKLEELKKRTRTEAYRRNRGLVEKGSKRRAGIVDEDAEDGEARFGMRLARGDRHVHEWGRPVLDADSGMEVKTCVECGAECEEIEL